MLYSSATRQYAAYTAACMTVKKTRQVVMLYDGAIRFVKQAMTAIDEENLQDRYNKLERATAIVNGLQSSLDFENGGNIAELLDDYYYSIYMRLMSVHRSNSKETCEQVIKELKMMREAWVDVDEGYEAEEMDDESAEKLAEEVAAEAASGHDEAARISV